jgi:hypothetical protein
MEVRFESGRVVRITCKKISASLGRLALSALAVRCLIHGDYWTFTYVAFIIGMLAAAGTEK